MNWSMIRAYRRRLSFSPALRLALAALLAALALAITAESAAAKTLRIPILVPITGFLSLEGTSQRNGAVMALEEAAAGGADIAWSVTDTGTAPETAVNAFLRAVDGPGVVAVVAPILGSQMLALLPLAEEFRVPLVTISGTAAVTEQSNPFVFRFFPGDAVVKEAHARYAVEVLGAHRPALVTQTTAYGQSGRRNLERVLAGLGDPPVLEETLDVGVKDMFPVLSKVKASGADVLLAQLHAGPTALLMRQAKAFGLDIPIVAGSALHQPATAALLEPGELANACAETGSSPVSEATPAIAAWTARYRARFATEPDAFALAQYDGVRMVLAALNTGANDAGGVRDYLAATLFEGLAMTYASDGAGNMAHDAVIICYDGETRVPRVVQRYHNVSGLASLAD